MKKLLLYGFAWLTGSVVLSVALAADVRPNILIILADDLGYADVGFNGGKDIKTPNLDTLAAAGARLEQFYVQPVCSPTRASLMTGRYPMRYGLQVGVIRPWENRGLPLEERVLPKVLKEEIRDRFNARAVELGIPDLLDMIADESVGTTEEAILPFLAEKGHPALTMETLM